MGIFEGTERLTMKGREEERIQAFLYPYHTWVQNPADHSRHHYDKHGQEFEVPTHDTASLHMGHVLTRETSLDNNLSMTHGSYNISMTTACMFLTSVIAKELI